MSKLNKFALFGMLFISSILLGNWMYSSQIFAIEAQNENNHDQSGNLNEAEINADIEQENKCKKDTECENENEINNQLNILNNKTQSQQGQSVIPACETCFTQNLNQDEITKFLLAISKQDVTFSNIEDICQQIDKRINANEPNFPEILAIAIFVAGEDAQIPIEKINALADCLEEVYGITIPRPT